MSENTKSRRPNKQKPQIERFSSREYRPYALAIGQLSLAWNDLHESVCVLFNSIASITDNEKTQAAFQAVDSDRIKRKMLKAVFSQLEPDEIRLNPRAIDDIKWVCGQIDALEEGRNNAVHGPLHSFIYGRIFDLPEGIQPNDVYGNTRAAKLRNKNLLTEYRYVRDAAIVLRDFIDAMEDSWRWLDRRPSTWPERPQLPNRGQKSRDLAQHSDRSKRE